MKKSILALLMAALVGLTACSTDTGSSGFAGSNPAESSSEIADAAPEPAPVPIITPGEPISTADFDFTLNYVAFSDKVAPSKASGTSTCYETPSGKVYIHVDGSYYNNSTRSVCTRDLPVAAANYKDGHIYEGISFVEAPDGDRFEWGSYMIVCDPLITCHYHCLIECPAEVESSDAPLYISIPLGGTTYQYQIR